MSTRSTIALAEADGLSVHLYNEMHDGCVHLAIEGDCNSAVDVVIPGWMVKPLAKIIEPSTELGRDDVQAI